MADWEAETICFFFLNLRQTSLILKVKLNVIFSLNIKTYSIIFIVIIKNIIFSIIIFKTFRTLSLFNILIFYLHYFIKPKLILLDKIFFSFMFIFI